MRFTGVAIRKQRAKMLYRGETVKRNSKVCYPQLAEKALNEVRLGKNATAR